MFYLTKIKKIINPSYFIFPFMWFYNKPPLVLSFKTNPKLQNYITNKIISTVFKIQMILFWTGFVSHWFSKLKAKAKH
jgi:hypothetical protein